MLRAIRVRELCNDAGLRTLRSVVWSIRSLGYRECEGRRHGGHLSWQATSCYKDGASLSCQLI